MNRESEPRLAKFDPDLVLLWKGSPLFTIIHTSHHHNHWRNDTSYNCCVGLKKQQWPCLSREHDRLSDETIPKYLLEGINVDRSELVISWASRSLAGMAPRSFFDKQPAIETMMLLKQRHNIPVEPDWMGAAISVCPLSWSKLLLVSQPV